MGLNPECVPESLSERVACLRVSMMANNTPWSWVECFHVIHQLFPIRVPTESIYSDDIAGYRDHVCLSSINHWDLGMTRL